MPVFEFPIVVRVRANSRAELDVNRAVAALDGRPGIESVRVDTGLVREVVRTPDVDALQTIAVKLLSVQLAAPNGDLDLNAVRQEAVAALGLDPNEVPMPAGSDAPA